MVTRLLGFLAFRIIRHYTKHATATERASPAKPCSLLESAMSKPRSHSGHVVPKSCSHSGPVLAYQGVTYSRLRQPTSTLKPTVPMVVDAQPCPALPARASMAVKSTPTQPIAAPATILGVRLFKQRLTVVSEACACGITDQCCPGVQLLARHQPDASLLRLPGGSQQARPTAQCAHHMGARRAAHGLLQPRCCRHTVCGSDSLRSTAPTLTLAAALLPSSHACLCAG